MNMMKCQMQRFRILSPSSSSLSSLSCDPSILETSRSRNNKITTNRIVRTYSCTRSNPMTTTTIESESSPNKTSLWFRHTQLPKTASIIGAPMTYGQPYVGTDHGPKRLRGKGLLQQLSSLGWRINDMPDLDFESMSQEVYGKVQLQPQPDQQQRQQEQEEDGDMDNLTTTTSYNSNSNSAHPNAKHSTLVGKGCLMLAELVYEERSNGRFPVVLGGDHSIAIGTLAGLLQAQPSTGVLWIDAHADLHTPWSSPSGNIHGMPLGFLLKNHLHRGGVAGFSWLDDGLFPTRLPSNSLVYIGLRDVDASERFFLKQFNIRTYTMHDIDRYGIGYVMEEALDYLGKDRPLHVSYDIDAIDPTHAPATGTAVRGGLTYREAHYVAEAVASSGNLASVEMVELNPMLAEKEGGENTVELALGILTSLMGKSIL